MIIELKNQGLSVKNQVPIPVYYGNELLPIDLRLDLIVNDTIILELKSVEELKPVHFKQLKTYLKLTNKRLGLLVNFNVNSIMKDAIHRIPNNL